MSNNKDNYYIVGLGNPGDKYRGSRHNAGFEFLDLLSKEFRSSWTEDKKTKYSISSVNLPSGKTLRMVKPMSFMNLSGEPLLASIKFYKDIDCSQAGTPLNLLVVHVELDFKQGVLKVKYGGGAGGHKGIQSIINILGTQAFYRYRIGIGHPRDTLTAEAGNQFIDVSDWVLSRMNGADVGAVNDLNLKVVSNLYKQLSCDNQNLDFSKILGSSVLV